MNVVAVVVVVVAVFLFVVVFVIVIAVINFLPSNFLFLSLFLKVLRPGR